MKDRVHTNRERIEKVRSVFVAIEELTDTVREMRGTDDLLTHTLIGIRDAALEADGSLEAIESFLAERNALDKVE